MKIYGFSQLIMVVLIASAVPPTAKAEASFTQATGDSYRTLPTVKAPLFCATIKAQAISPYPENLTSILDTQRIQTALGSQACSGGGAVLLSKNGTQSAFVSGPLNVPYGISLVIGQGVTLYASRQASLYNNTAYSNVTGAGHCGQSGTSESSCFPFITMKSNTGIFGPGTIDGQGGQPILYASGAGSWSAPTACSTTAQYPPMPSSFPSAISWWDLVNCVAIINYVNDELAKETGETKPSSQAQSVPRLIRGTSVSNLIFGNVTLQNSPNVHIDMEHANNVTIWGVKINSPSYNARYFQPGLKPGESSILLEAAPNTAGIYLNNVINATVEDSYMNTGDDQIAIASFVPPNSSERPTTPLTQNITIKGDHLYGGHGLSIGSVTAGGISNVLAEDITINGGPNISTYSGIRIKSDDGNGGNVDTITYNDFCIQNVKYPLYITTHYDDGPTTSGVTWSPSYSNIYIIDTSIYSASSGSGYMVIDGDPTAPIDIGLQDVLMDKNTQNALNPSSNTGNGNNILANAVVSLLDNYVSALPAGANAVPVGTSKGNPTNYHTNSAALPDTSRTSSCLNRLAVSFPGK